MVLGVNTVERTEKKLIGVAIAESMDALPFLDKFARVRYDIAFMGRI